LELVFAIVHDLADRRLRIPRYFHKIESGFLGARNGIALGNRAEIFSVLIDELNVPRSDRIVDPGAVLFAWFGSEWPTNGRTLLCC